MLPKTQARTLWKRYGLAVVLILVLVTASHVTALVASQAGGEHAHAINISGRQRMLSQRILFFGHSVQFSQGKEAADAIGPLRDAVDLFESSHIALTQGRDLNEDLRNLYFGAAIEPPLDSLVRGFVSDARALTAGDTVLAREAWERMRMIGPGPLLLALDQAVTGFENQARRNVEWIRVVSHVSFALALIVLLAEALFIFLPAHRIVVKALNALEDKIRDLRQSNIEREEALTESRMKSEFVANISHEIRTPLNGILGMAQLIEQDGLDKQQRHGIEVIQSCGDALLTLINDVLDISRIEAGLIDLHKTPFELSELLRSAEAAVAGTAIAKGVELRCENEFDDTARFLGDQRFIRQILINLLGNAVKFTESGTVTLRVNPHSGGQLRFSVTDSGPGIAPDQQATIFERFAQADDAECKKHKGSGLGLAISKNLTDIMGGQIGVMSEPGKGATFWFDLPLTACRKRSPKDQTASEPAPIAPLSQSPRKLLLAEDNAINQAIIQETMRARGDIDLTIVTNGQEAIDALKAASFDLVLMDINMPVMSGVDAIQKIRSSDDPYADVPIVVLTANAVEGQVEEYIAMGAQDCLTKPIDLKALFRMIDRHARAPSTGQNKTADQPSQSAATR